MSAEVEKRYTNKEFCEMYGITPRTAARWRKNRYIHFTVTPSGKIRYLQRYIDAFDEGNEGRARKKQKAIRPPAPRSTDQPRGGDSTYQRACNAT